MITENVSHFKTFLTNSLAVFFVLRRVVNLDCILGDVHYVYVTLNQDTSVQSSQADDCIQGSYFRVTAVASTPYYDSYRSSIGMEFV